MKNKSGQQIKLGVLVTVGVGLLILAIYFIGSRQHMFSQTFEVSAVFKDVSGLQVGNNVRFSGITVGTVNKIQIISDTSVRVSLVIESRTQQFIKKDAIAVISSDGLMGNKVMTINPGSTGGAEIENGDEIATIQPVTIDDIMVKLKETADNAALITKDLAIVMNNVSSGKGTIGKLFMDSSLADNLDEMLAGAIDAVSGLDENLEAVQSSFLFRGFFRRKEREKQRELERQKKLEQEQ
ncbi:MAG: MCE family protein [Chitinophagaceae bacterium]|nr:MAG: MCE family protein [Chitinophagaceae bacterium]